MTLWVYLVHQKICEVLSPGTAQCDLVGEWGQTAVIDDINMSALPDWELFGVR